MKNRKKEELKPMLYLKKKIYSPSMLKAIETKPEGGRRGREAAKASGGQDGYKS